MERELPPDIIYLIPDDNGIDWLWCEDPAPGVGMEEEDSVKYVRVKPSITTERLAQIIHQITQNSICNNLHDINIYLATELQKVMRIEEKE